MRPSSPSDEIARLAAELDRSASRPPDGPAPPAVPRGYLAATRTPTYGFLAALPLFVLYEVGVLAANGAGPVQIRVGADVWLKTLLQSVGLGGWAAIGGVVVLIGAGVFVAERERRPALVPAYFGGVVGESFVYALVLAALVGGVVGALFGRVLWPAAMLQMGVPGGYGMELALSIGAGLYEELVFRVLLVGGLAWVLRRAAGLTAGRAVLVAALVGAVVFSAVHHLGPFGEAFTLSAFTFRFLFGLALNGVFLVRGFAVAAWTHALYDVLVVSGWFS
ncbi:MAG TPA: CPBP family glutamic-type intramembrane protease [Rubricoccaceae bacterium]|jgi:membrane protease YdiL (CAAX protease family)